MFGLGALSSLAGGMIEGRQSADEERRRRLEQQLLDWDVQGMQALGSAFPGLGGGQPGPYPPMPGQPSTPGPQNAPMSPAPPPAMGSPAGPPVDAANLPSSEVIPDRSRYERELQDPRVRNLVFSRIQSEDPSDARAQLESIINRAARRGQTLVQAVMDPGYYPGPIQNRGGGGPGFQGAVEDVLGYSDVTRGATGNASGNVGFGYGQRARDPYTYMSPSGERYGREAVDFPAGGPPPGSPSPPSSRGGLPQLDLPTLASRIRDRNPNLPPQALFMALKRAEPLLNSQAKTELARIQADYRKELMGVREGELGLRERLAQLSEERLRSSERTQDRSLNVRERQQNLREETARGGAPAEPSTVGQGGYVPPSERGKAESNVPPKGVMGFTAQSIEANAENLLQTGRLPPGLTRTTQGREIMKAIENRAFQLAEQRGISSKDLPNIWQYRPAAIKWITGKQGDTVTSLGVVVDHLDTVRELGQALENGDLQLFNRLAAAWAKATGKPEPTNLNAAAHIVGSEVIKALGVAGAGTEAERNAAADQFNAAQSPAQLEGAINAVQKLLAGQLSGKWRQANTVGVPREQFDKMLGPRALEVLSGLEKKETGVPTSGGGVTAPGGWKIERVD